MLIREFKAWFDGFTEEMKSTPTKAQWARIKERVAEIDGQQVTYKYFYEHYWPNHFYLSSPNRWTTYTANTVAQGTSNNCYFTSTNAMNALGKAEASLVR